MYSYITHPMFQNGGPLDHLFPYTGGGKLTPNQKYNNFLNQINRLKIQKLNYPSNQPIRGAHPLLPPLTEIPDQSFNVRFPKPNYNLPFPAFYDRKTKEWIYDLSLKNKNVHGRYIGPYPFKSEGFISTSLNRLPENHLMNRNYTDIKKELEKTILERTKAPSRFSKFINSPFMKTLGKVAKRLDPFPFLMAPAYPEMFQDQNMMQPTVMRKGGIIPHWAKSYNPYI